MSDSSPLTVVFLADVPAAAATTTIIIGLLLLLLINAKLFAIFAAAAVADDDGDQDGNDEDGLLGWLDLALEWGGKGGMAWHPSITSICGDSDVISSSLCLSDFTLLYDGK